MRENVAFGVIFRALLHTFHRLDFRQQNLEQAGLIQQLKAGLGSSLRQDPRNLLADSFPGNLADGRREIANRRESLAFNRESQARGEAYGADHPQSVLCKTSARITDGAY